MAIASITLWLNNPNRHYQTGVSLYEQYGTKRSLKVLFKGGESPYHATRLAAELELLNEQVIVTDQAAAPLVAARVPDRRPAEPPPLLPALADIPLTLKRHSLDDEQWANAPDAIKDLFVQNSKLKSRSDLAFHKLSIVSSNADRLTLALARLNDNDAINENWRLIKEYQASGKVTKQLQEESLVSVEKLSLKELVKVLMNYPTYITKAKAGLKKMEAGQKRSAAELKLQAKELYLKAAWERVDNE